MALALCVECQARPRRTPHANTKYCTPCCARCGATWTEVYELTGYEGLRQPQKDAS